MRLRSRYSFSPASRPFFAGQVAELEVAQLGVAQLVLQGALGLLGDVEGELEALRVQPLTSRFIQV